MDQDSHVVSLSISLPRSMRDQARRAAFAQQRSLSSLVRVLLTEHLSEQPAGSPPSAVHRGGSSSTANAPFSLAQ